MFNIKPFSRLIASAKVAFEGITTPVDRLIACVLVVPISIFLMLSMTPVENRLQTQRVHDKNISALRGEINDLRRLQQSSEEARKEIAEREDKLSKELVEQDSITMQIIWGSEEARNYYQSGYLGLGNMFNQYSSDNNLMIAAMTSATLACLLSVILNGQGSAILALGAGLAIGLFAVIAAKGTKAFLVAGYSQATELDPYSIMLLAFLAGAYQHRLLELLIKVVDTQADRVTLQPKMPDPKNQQPQQQHAPDKTPG
jgi:hypothetical protein